VTAVAAVIALLQEEITPAGCSRFRCVRFRRAGALQPGAGYAIRLRRVSACFDMPVKTIET
jgi:hypothetical protein